MKHIFIILISLFINANLFGQFQSPDFSDPSIKNILSPTHASVIYKDSLGFIWLGTNIGLKKYDGVEETDYPFYTSNIDHTERVTAIAELPDRSMLAGNKYGLWILKRHTQKLEQIFSEEIKFPVLSLLKSRNNNNVYIGTANGLYIYNVEADSIELLFTSTVTDSFTGPILDIASDDSGMIWALTSRSVISYDAMSKTPRTYVSDKGVLMTCFLYADNNLYIGTENSGIRTFDIKNNKYSNFLHLNVPVTCVARYKKGVLIVGTIDEGLFFVKMDDTKILNKLTFDPKAKTGISSNSISSVLVDEFSNIWLGNAFYIGIDLLKYNTSPFNIYSFEDFTTKNIIVRSFFLNGSEKLIGTREGLYYINEDKKFVKYYRKEDNSSLNGLRSNIIFSIYYYDHKYFIGTCGGGLSVLDPVTQKISTLNDASLLLSGDIFSFYEDKKGNLWIATLNGIYSYDNETQKVKTYTSNNSGLLDNIVYQIYCDSSDRVWIATLKNLCLLDTDTGVLSSVDRLNTFIGDKGVRNIFEDANGNLYFALLGGRKLVCSDRDLENFHYVTQTPEGTVFGDEFYDELPWNGVLDNADNLWMVSSNGLIRADKNMTDWRLFTKRDGLPDNVFIDAAPNFKDEKGVIWFPNMKGLIYFNPEQVSLDSIKRPLVFTNFSVNGVSLFSKYENSILKGETITLQRKENNIALSLVSLTYDNNLESIIYEYKLDGYDTTWSKITGHKNVVYDDLPAGNYTFYIREYMNNNSLQSVSFVIEPLFSLYQYLLILFVAVCIVAGSVFIYIKYLKNKNIMSFQISKKTEDKYKYMKIKDSEAKEIVEKLTEYFANERPYLDPNLKIHDIATAIGYSAPILSQVFNQYLNTRFYDYISTYRIEEFKRLIDEINYSKYTMITLGKMSGFNSQASFFRSFKKGTGLTPTEYIKKKESQKK